MSVKWLTLDTLEGSTYLAPPDRKTDECDDTELVQR